MPELSSSELHNILNNLFPLVNEAARRVMDVYNQPFGVDIKTDKSPITIADRKSNQILIDGLNSITPDIPIISEESKADSFNKRKDYTYCWIIDPLDGTKEFIKKNGEFAINVALCFQNEIILGLVVAPVSNEIAWAIKGQGAFLRNSDGKVEKLNCGVMDHTKSKLRVLTSRSHISDKTQKMLDRLDDPVLIPKGSSWKFVLIAANRADYYPRPGTTMEWDSAAPQIILEEAGGSIFEIETGKRLLYNKKDLRNPEFIAQGMTNAKN